MTKAAELAKMGEVLTNGQIGGRRNMIINGAMQVAQRGTSVTGLGDGDEGYVDIRRRAGFDAIRNRDHRGLAATSPASRGVLVAALPCSDSGLGQRGGR